MDWTNNGGLWMECKEQITWYKRHTYKRQTLKLGTELSMSMNPG